MLTDLEKEVIDASCKLHNSFCKLPVLHPSDIKDECYYIHAIQNLVMAREAYRSNPELFPVKGIGSTPVNIVTASGLIGLVSIDDLGAKTVNPVSSKKCFVCRIYKRVINWLRIREPADTKL